MGSMLDDAINAASHYDGKKPLYNIPDESWNHIRRGYAFHADTLKAINDGDLQTFIDAQGGLMDSVGDYEQSLINTVSELLGVIAEWQMLQFSAKRLSAHVFKDTPDHDEFNQAWDVKYNSYNDMLKRYLREAENILTADSEVSFRRFGEMSQSRGVEPPSLMEEIANARAERRASRNTTRMRMMKAILASVLQSSYQTCDCWACKLLVQFERGDIDGYTYVEQAIVQARNNGDSDEKIQSNIVHFIDAVGKAERGEIPYIRLTMDDIVRASRDNGYEVSKVDYGWAVRAKTSTNGSGAEPTSPPSTNGVTEPGGSAPSSAG